jgi:hypothetical protein
MAEGMACHEAWDGFGVLQFSQLTRENEARLA